MQKRALIWAAVSTRPQADEDEKYSIPVQIEDGEAMCRENGWDIADTLIVPGHSRDYRTLDQLAADARKKGISAFDRLIKHFKDRDFDYFICRDANRFARKASLLHYIAEMIVEDCGALIYSQSDHMFIDSENLPWWATIQGYKVRAEVKALVDGHRKGMTKRAERGLPTSSQILSSHVVIRDDLGNAVRLEVDETRRRLWDDVYRLLVDEHLPWRRLEEALAELGHTNKEGKPYRRNYIRRLMSSPTFWGHSSRYHFKLHLNDTRGWNWVYNPAKPPPKEVILFRNTHQPVYTGEQSRRLIAELERPARQRKGRALPYRSNRYSGLVICRGCRRIMNYQGSQPYVYLLCYNARYTPHTCTNHTGIRERELDTFTRRLQERLRNGERIQDIVAVRDNRQELEYRRKQLETERDTLLAQMQRAVRKQLSAPSIEAEKIYDEEIKIVSGKVSTIKDQLSLIEFEEVYDLETQENEARKFAELGETLWQLPEPDFNALLHRVLGKKGIAVYQAEVAGFMDMP